jgi:hypothetical protein
MRTETRLRTAILGALVATLPAIEARGDEVYTFVVKKQEEKKAARKGWNLADWLSQRDRFRTQDLWLAMHTPSPYEFSLGGDYRFLKQPKDERDYRLQMTAYARIFGVKLEQESKPARWNALVNVRIFGLYQQGTNLTLFGGVRAQADPVSFRSAVYGASATIYLTRYAGTELEYRRYGAGTADRGGSGRAGYQTEGNFFIDFRFLRVYAGYLRSEIDPATEKGPQVGARFFF